MNAIPPIAGNAPADAAFTARPVPADAETLAAYFAQVRSFEADRLRSLRRSQRLAWTVAVVAAVVAASACLAVAALTPLKTVEPIVFRVDASTGIVDAVHDLRGGPQTQTEAVARYFVAQYLRAREGYAHAEAEHQFRTVSLLSAPAEQARYVAWFRGSNPESPQVTLGRAGTSRVAIKSISFIGPRLAQVRWVREVRREGMPQARGGGPETSHWVSTLAFDWSQNAISNQDRLVNPLGFLVTDYRVDPEVP
ncbi:MAG: virB8 family protein [Thermoleophilia bacterium]|nr:virB8 family protein [Thermoleophilia bacterium]